MSHLTEQLDTMADLVAALPPGAEPRRALAVVVADLEQLAGTQRDGAPGGPAGEEVVLARRFAAAHRRLLRDRSHLPPDTGPRLDAHAAMLRDPDAALRSAWVQWQDLRGNEAPLPDRMTAFERVALARRAVCR